MKSHISIMLLLILISTVGILNAQTSVLSQSAPTPMPTLTPLPTFTPSPTPTITPVLQQSVEIIPPDTATTAELVATRNIIESRLLEASITVQDIAITEANTIQVQYIGDEIMGYGLMNRVGYLEVIDLSLFTLPLRTSYLDVPILTTARSDNPLYATVIGSDTDIEQPLGNPFNQGQPFLSLVTGDQIAPENILYGNGVFGIRIVGRDDNARQMLINVTRNARWELLGIVLDGRVIAIPYIQEAMDHIEVWNLAWDNERDIEIVRILLETGPLPFTPQIVRSE